MSDKDKNYEINIAKIKLAKEYTEADNIIRYLTHPDDNSISLTPSEKTKLDILKFTHGLRMRYSRKIDIVGILCHMHDIKERQAYKYIKECETVFASLEDVNKDYERNFLLEASRKNIEIAFATRKSDLITKALMAHYELCGLREVNIELPDFSALEPSNYIISLPDAQQNLLKKMLQGGNLNFADIMPHQEVTFDIPHKDVSDAAE